MEDNKINSLKNSTKLLHELKTKIIELEAKNEILTKSVMIHELKIKELNCLYYMSLLAENPYNTLNKIIQGIVELIPSAFKYPDQIAARIIWNNKEFITSRFKETSQKLTKLFVYKDSVFGIFDVYHMYANDSSEYDFSNEDKITFNYIVQRLENIIDNKYKQLAENLNEGIFIINRDAVFTYVNPYMAEMLDYKTDEVVGKSLFSFMAEEWITIVENKFERQKKQKTLKEEFQTEFVTKYGKRIYTSISMSVIFDKYNNYISTLALVKDIIILKKISQALQKAKEHAESANKAKSEFLASISHEIRTPLTSIIGISDLLWQTALNPEQKKYVQILETAGESLLSLINSILDLSKIEVSYIELEEIEFDLIKNIEQISKLMTFRADEKKIEFICNLAKDTPARLIGDIKRLKQILFNLLVNAVKYTEKGRVILEINPYYPNKKKDDIELYFVVTDTGKGIPQDKLDVIFDKFTQIDSDKMSRYGGYGLGLNIAQKLTKLMGGNLFVKSELGVGSTFYFMVPFKIQSQVSEKKIQDEIIIQKKINILIVEDELYSRFILKEYFRNTSCNVDTAENGQIALDKFISQKYDLIFMDIQMPVMDGFASAKAIREYERGKKLKPIPLIALTASVFKESVEKSVECGFTDYIIKPVKRDMLIKAAYSHTLQNYKTKPGSKKEKSYATDKQKLLKHLIPGLLNDIRQSVNILIKSLEQDDFETIAKIAHKIKGTSGLYDLNDIKNTANNILKIAKEKDAKELKKNIYMLLKYIDSFR